ncbi:MAG: hypothetical protein KF882_06275 [Bacteroidia bacterium]|nr:hypothetical protein [Bacteroidia bacterium]MCO5253324.1 hypothetical protein [Bacteroidota bacterium]
MLQGYGQNYMLSTNVHIGNRGNGIGFAIREKSQNRMNTNYELNLIGLKDYKELRISNVGMTSSNSNIEPGTFKYGKINQILQIKAAYGKEITLIKRPDRNAIGLIWNSTAGINFALQIPIYIDYITPGQNEQGFITVRYDPRIHERSNIILAHSYYDKGLTSARLIPSFFVKQGLIMEFGNYSNSPNRIEGGFMLDAFPIRPEIMYDHKQPHIIAAFYISFAVLNFEI